MNAIISSGQSASGPTNVSRRSVLLGFGAGALILAARLSPAAAASETPYGGDAMPGGLKDDPTIFLAIEENGTVNLLCHRAEMGQGIRTGWAAVVADELEADLARLHLSQAPGNEARYGNQNTDGSRSMRQHFLPLRRMSAAARQMLEQEAAARWSVPVSEVRAQNHEVVHVPSDRRMGYGTLAKGAAARAVPAGDALVLKAQRRSAISVRKPSRLSTTTPLRPVPPRTALMPRWMAWLTRSSMSQ